VGRIKTQILLDRLCLLWWINVVCNDNEGKHEGKDDDDSVNRDKKSYKDIDISRISLYSSRLNAWQTVHVVSSVPSSFKGIVVITVKLVHDMLYVLGHSGGRYDVM
jgi:hypothetical protein